MGTDDEIQDLKNRVEKLEAALLRPVVTIHPPTPRPAPKKKPAKKR